MMKFSEVLDIYLTAREKRGMFVEGAPLWEHWNTVMLSGGELLDSFFNQPLSEVINPPIKQEGSSLLGDQSMNEELRLMLEKVASMPCWADDTTLDVNLRSNNNFNTAYEGGIDSGGTLFARYLLSKFYKGEDQI